MKIELTFPGNLKIIAETTLECYALESWWTSFNSVDRSAGAPVPGTDRKSTISVDYLSASGGTI